jgi:hypothetical protein
MDPVLAAPAVAEAAAPAVAEAAAAAALPPNFVDNVFKCYTDNIDTSFRVCMVIDMFGYERDLSAIYPVLGNSVGQLIFFATHVCDHHYNGEPLPSITFDLLPIEVIAQVEEALAIRWAEWERTIGHVFSKESRK